jgi:rhodanese-like protein
MPKLASRSRAVTEFPAAPSKEAAAYFARLLAYETDCWDVHEALETPDPGFVLLDVRSPEMFEDGHLPRAVSLPQGTRMARM